MSQIPYKLSTEMSGIIPSGDPGWSGRPPPADGESFILHPSHSTTELELEREVSRKTKRKLHFFPTRNHERFQAASPSLSPPQNRPNLSPWLRRALKAQSFSIQEVENFEPLDPRTPSFVSGKRELQSSGGNDCGGGMRRLCGSGRQETRLEQRSLLDC